MRSIDALINTETFEELWNQSKQEDQEAVTKYIEDRDKTKIIEWIKGHPSLDIGESPVSYLRKIAKDLKIPNYSRLLKDQLIRRIKQKKGENGD
jgi:hypothetical protein